MTERRTVTRAGAMAGAGLLLAAGLAYLVAKSLFSHEPEVDFRFLWLAGHMWAAGQDPYGPDYVALGRRLFPTGNPVAYWLYPPNWWPVCRLLATMPVERSLLVWRALNALLLIVGGALLAEAATRRLELAFRWSIVAAFVGWTCLTAATPQVLAMGQTSLVIWFGVCLLGRGLLLERPALVAAGLTLVLLKPHMGVVAAAALLPDRRWRGAVLAAAAASLLLALPQLVAFGPIASAQAFVANLGHHADVPMNAPPGTVGLVHVAYGATGVVLPATVATLIAATAAAAYGWQVARVRGDGALLLGLIVAIGCALLPLHAYDMIWLAGLLPLLLTGGRLAQGAIAAALLIAFRPAPIELRLIGSPADPQFAGTVLLTLAALLGLAGVALSLRRAPAAPDRRAA